MALLLSYRLWTHPVLCSRHKGSHRQKLKLPHGISLQYPTRLQVQKAGEPWTQAEKMKVKVAPAIQGPNASYIDVSLQL